MTSVAELPIAEPVSDGLGPMQRWERDCAPDVVEVVMQRVAEGETLKAICRSRGWPYARVATWVAEDEGRVKAYEAASRIWVDGLARETVAIADKAEDVPAAKLKVDTRFRIAGKLHREVYGEVVRQEVVLDPFTEMLRRVSERRLAALRETQRPAERVVEALPALPVTEHELI